ncbi:unnamed protein product [Allacma fusca]|uniref:Copper type II ascorbate-dependent monooxygenase C-terminal domain-containing protein n=1 Tax=Allacma fusca TaxID=39272 RepID=A0A8J2LU39_9HEXA|nr:unnamed protein product [Allacma fusca]
MAIWVVRVSVKSIRSKFPEGGITAFNILLHSHLSGRKMKLRHFRDGKELPWIATDDHYDFNYQQNRLLLENRQILRGDQRIAECTDSSTHVNPPAGILGGIRTTDEMCDTYLMYYPRMKNLDICASAFQNFAWLLPTLGIQALDSYFGPNDPTILSPVSLAGKKFSEVVNAFNWTPELKMGFQNRTRFSDQ